MIKTYCLLAFVLPSLLCFAQVDYITSYNKAKLEETIKDYHNAVIDYSMAINIDPTHTEAYYYRGIALLRLSYFADAIQNFDKAIQLSKKAEKGKNTQQSQGRYYANSYFYRAEAEFQVRDFEPAVKDYSQAIKKGVDSLADAFNGRGRARKRVADYYHTDYLDAISDFDKGIELNPSSAFGYYHRGTAEYNGRNYTAALKDITMAVSLDNTDADKFFWLGMAQSRLQNYVEAIRNFSKSILLNPYEIREYENRALAESALGQNDAARADLEKVAELKYPR